MLYGSVGLVAAMPFQPLVDQGDFDPSLAFCTTAVQIDVIPSLAGLKHEY